MISVEITKFLLKNDMNQRHKIWTSTWCEKMYNNIEADMMTAYKEKKRHKQIDRIIVYIYDLYVYMRAWHTCVTYMCMWHMTYIYDLCVYIPKWHICHLYVYMQAWHTHVTCMCIWNMTYICDLHVYMQTKDTYFQPTHEFWRASNLVNLGEDHLTENLH